MSELLAFEAALAKAWPPADWQDVSLVVAVSGGADSVALLRGLVRLKSAGAGRLTVAHFNHRLRPLEADADESFVAALAKELNFPCRVGREEAGELARAGRDGIEAAARHTRYRFLADIAAELGARYVVTAHTADDQVETITQRFFRGTGLNGLAGMRRARLLGPGVTLLRPLLTIRRNELRRYLEALGQPWCEDATNATTDATRNWLRAELLPSVERSINPAAAAAILRLGQLAAESQSVIEQWAAQLAERALDTGPAGEIVCRSELLGSASRAVVREMFVAAWRERGWPEQAMGFEEWDALATLALDLAKDAPEHDFPGGIRIGKVAGRLTLARRGR